MAAHAPRDELRISVAQFRPHWLSKAKTTAKLIETMATAASAGAELVVFPEACLSGYPFWICRTNGAAFEDPRQKRAYGQFLDAAIEIDGPEVAQLVEASRDLKIACITGSNERGRRVGRGTVYCTLLTIEPDHGLRRAHRKLMPTYDERLCWGIGDARDLSACQIGAAMVGGLNCWESWMPLARFALYRSGADVLVNLWPGNPVVLRDAARLAALEGRVWSVAASGVLSLADVPDDFEFKADLAKDGVDIIFQGGSMIIAPDGTVVAQAADGEESLLPYTLSLAAVREARHSVDPSGHYARSDLLKLEIVRSREDEPER
jgi:nitrilase